MPPLRTEDGTQLDPKVLKVVRALRNVESQGNYNAVGDGGKSHGAYQWHGDNWSNAARQILGDANAPMTPANQNKVAYHQVKAYKDAGRDPEEIAALWNGASKDKTTGRYVYNAPEYGVKFRAALQGQNENTTSQPTPSQPTEDDVAKEQSGATFAAKTGDNPFVAGLKTLGNVPASLGRFVGGAIDAVNPISTVGRLAQIPGAIADLAKQKQKPLELAKNLATGIYESTVPQAGRELLRGDTEAAQRSITNDPIGSVAPFVLGARGLAGAADTALSRSATHNYVQNIGENTVNRVPIPKPTTTFTSAFDDAVSKVGGSTAKVLTAPFKLAGDIAGKTADFGIKQATGLSGETRATIAENPEAFTKTARGKVDRESLGKTIQSELNRHIDSMADNADAYKPVRAQNTKVSVDPNFIDKNLAATAKVTIKKGKIVADTTSKVREGRDIESLQKVYDFWKPAFKRGFLSPEEFLNFRQDLAKAAKYGRDIGKSAPVEDVASVLRGKFNTEYRKQISGLDKLDEQTSSELTEFKELKKGLLDRDGKLTDGAITRIANATNKGRDQVLARLEQISPGITRQIKIVKAIEDIEKASENKVGTYGRGALAAGSLITGNIPGIIATILAQPEVAVPILRQYGFAKPLVTPVLRALKKGATMVNNVGDSEALPSFIPTQPQSLSR